jgi:hypothetical protein
MMRFDRAGLPLHVFLLPSATVRATTGDMVRGGETIIAVLN